MNSIFQSVIDEHLKSLDRDNPRDLVDFYLLAIEENKNDPNTTFKDDCE